jgi:hypothetical protein
VCIFFNFPSVRFASAQLTSSPLFFLPGAASTPSDVATPLHRVTLPFHVVKMSSLLPLHLLSTLHLVVSPLKLKLKYWIYTTATARLSFSIAIKKSHLNLGHSLHHSTTSLFYLLTSQSATSSELHSLLLLFTIIPHISSIRTTKRWTTRPYFTYWITIGI